MRKTLNKTIVAGVFLTVCLTWVNGRLAADTIPAAKAQAGAKAAGPTQDEADAIDRFKQRNFDGTP